jgi:hypothetical protein
MTKINGSLEIGNTGYPIGNLVPYVLFEGSSQTITLSDSKNNYSLLEITYGNSWLSCGTIVVPSNIGYVALWAGVGWGGNLGLNFGCGYFNFSGKNITSDNADRHRTFVFNANGDMSVTRENIVYIKKVVGYK